MPVVPYRGVDFGQLALGNDLKAVPR